MKNGQSEKPQKGRRFCEKTDGEMIRKYFAEMPTAELARRLGLTVKQIENYVYRENPNDWARKSAALLSAENSVKGRKGGGRPKKS
jgi:hypothetical protein